MDRYSPYRLFTIDEWAELRRNTPLNLDQQELEQLRGINERVSLIEVEQVYLPLSRLLSFYVDAVQALNRDTRQFMGIESGKVPFILGVSGSVAVGKSTVARLLQALLARWPHHPKVDLVTTDGFLWPTAELERRRIMHRKGFPESYDLASLLQFLADVKGGRGNLKAPIYSHLRYDVVPDRFIEVDQPDILIVDGLNVLQSGSTRAGKPQVFVSDYFDYSIYIDAELDDLRRWYVNRFLTLRGSVFNQPGAYFSHYATLNDDEAIATASRIWAEINLVNLEQNIAPTRERARLILKKGPDHHMQNVQLRKL